jgi:hypothetical protein
VTYDDLIKQRGGPLMVEQRQSKLAKNTEATERWMRRLFRATTELKKLSDERKRLLKPRKNDKKATDWTPDKYVGCGGGLNDSLEEI